MEDNSQIPIAFAAAESDAIVAAPGVPVPAAAISTGLAPDGSDTSRAFPRLAFLLSLGWLGTNLGIAVANLPLKFLLKDGLHLAAPAVSLFFFLGEFTNYIKPVAGLLCDSAPLFGTRRRAYLLLSLLGTGIGYIVLSVVPRKYGWLLGTYALLYMTVVFTSTSLGGVMVEAGTRFRAAGRLTAQRLAMFRVGILLGNPLAGWLALYPFGIAMGVAALLHLVLVPLYYVTLPEPPVARPDRRVWQIALEQWRLLMSNRVLLSAMGMAFLVAASPGFGTPLLFQQTDTLHFSKPFVGTLGAVGAGFGLMGAIFYYAACRRLPLRLLLGGSIVVHALGTLLYLGYHTPQSAIFITAVSGLTVTLATLPIYDLAVRATPRGGEALGYSVMMSVWNVTNALSDYTGSLLFGRLHVTFAHLVWLNALTTACVLFVIPLMPAVLMRSRDGVGATAGAGTIPAENE